MFLHFHLNDYSLYACMHAKLLQLCLSLCDPINCSLARLLCTWDSSGNNIRMGCCTLLQGIFLTQGSNTRPLSLLHLSVGSLPLAPPEDQYLLGLNFSHQNYRRDVSDSSLTLIKNNFIIFI